MPISSNRSPSPLNRSTEFGNGNMRKSFNANPLTKSSRTFNPTTPANSPSEFPRRSKEGIAGLRGSREYKENEKGGAKSFMAPTISAISKISPSPRKKVLSDRNESVVEDHHEVHSFKVISEPKIHSFKPKTLEFQEVDVVDTIASLIPEPVIDAPPKIAPNPKEEICEEKPNVVVHKPPASPSPPLAPIDCDPCYLKVKHCSSPSTKVAPLDSDPHLPPYDPKTNYLSPRPQFLHYKPKPRIEVYLEKGGSDSEGKKLEDSFCSESNSDCENTEETLASGSENDSSSSVSPEEENHTIVSEIEPEYTQMKATPKASSRSFVRSKLVPFLLVFAIAGLLLPIIDTPVLSPSTHNAHVNFEGLSFNVKLWSDKIHSYFSTLISSPRGVVVQEFAPLYYGNSTVLNGEESLGYDVFQLKEDVIREVEDEFDVEVEMESEIEELSNEEEYNEEEMPEEEKVEGVVSEEYSIIVSEEQPVLMIETSEVQPESVQDSDVVNVQETAVPQSSESNVVTQSLESDMDTPVQTPELDVILSEVELDASDPIEEPDVLHQGTETGPDEQILVDVETQKSAVVQNMDYLSSVQKHVGVISAAVFTMLAATVYCYLKHRKAADTKVGKSGQAIKKMSKDDTDYHQDRFSSRPTEVEMFGESGPSEMSSSYKRSFSYNLRGSERNNEAQSSEKRPKYSKRESLATSSDYSYGSFTTYEKIHSKYGYGEEEVVTPVRRSSRIRKIVSPST